MPELHVEKTPLQIDQTRGCQGTAHTLTAVFLLTLLFTGFAQTASAANDDIPNDYYRAEFVIMERIDSPGAVIEHMANHEVQPTPETPDVLWAVSKNGTPSSTLNLVPTNELYLNSAAQRLTRSGHYKVLMSAGWYEAFPPDYKGKPLRVEIGDWLDGADTREIEGTITIDRKRYLHVGVHLNHWKLADTPPTTEMTEAPTEQGQAESEPEASSLAGMATGMDTDQAAQIAHTAPVELLTWIRETRRMRSEEIHFLDSPTIGVLVFFKKIEAEH